MADDKGIITKDDAKKELKKLIEFYNRNKDIYGKSPEQTIRQKLIDGLFEILGWDLRGKESADEVTLEEGIRNEASKKKKADYVFRLYGVPKFVVEAKAVKVDINSEIFREQAVGYTYNLACSWAVLTNFVQTRVYFVDKNDDTSIISIDNLSDLSKFDENFERLWLLSKEAAKNSLLEERIKGMGIKPEKEKVFKQLFEDLKDWRGKLSNEIRRKYPTYEGYELEEVVQRIIDRLIFIRKMEDLEVEERKLDQVARKINDGDGYVTYRQLKKVFEYYMEKYNSGLFGEEGKEQACDTIDIQDNVIKAVIQGMYTPTGRRVEYNFAAISGDVLGNIYEEYLSYILKVKENQKKTKLEGGRAHKKEQGIYYTPTYIVDYIVKNSVGEYIKNKSIDEILDTKILDSACGSGSFLIRAFSEVCKTIDAKMKKGEKATKSIALKTYDTRLTLPQKTTILLSCIYGVDLDKKAVEIAQLNMFLKLLEGETAETISKLKNTKKILPALNKNILVGNSLIDDDKVAGDLAFKWDERFKDSMARGGFDVVVGNPPYFNMETMSQKDKDALKKYECYAGKSDVLYYFYNLGIALLKPKGTLGFITSRYFLEATHAKKLRKYILENCELLKIIDLSNLPVFKDVGIHTVILNLKKRSDKGAKSNNKIFYKDISSIDQLNDSKGTLLEQSSLNENGWVVGGKNDLQLFKRIDSCKSTTLGNISIIEQGQKSGLNSAFTVTESVVRENKLEKGFIRKLVKNSYIKPYFIEDRGLFLIYASDEMTYENAPNTIKYLEKFKEQLKARAEACDGLYPWYRLQRPRSKELFDAKEKIIAPYRAEYNKFGYDNQQRYNDGGDIRIIVIKDTKYLTNYILAILNSKLMNFYYSFIGRKKGRMLEYFVEPLQKIPIVSSDDKVQKQFTHLVDKMISLNARLSDLGDKKTDERARIEEEIKKTDKEIDELIYKIYEITDEEKKIIEESLK